MTPNLKIEMIGSYGKYKAGEVLRIRSGSERKMLIERGLAKFAEPLPKPVKTRAEKAGKKRITFPERKYKVTFRGGNVNQFKHMVQTETK